MKSPFRSIRQTLFNEGKLLRYLGYAVGEVILIIVGILFALKINDWNEDRQERQDEQVALQALHEEISTNIRKLSSIHETHSKFSSDLNQLAELLEGAAIGSTINVEDSFLLPLVQFRTVEVGMGTLNTLLASGRIGLIRDSQLQHALAGWPARLADVSEDEVLIRDFVHERLIAELAGHVDLAGLLFDPDFPNPTDQKRSLAVNDKTRTFVAQRLRLARQLVRGSQGRLDGAKKISSMIEDELSP